MATQTVTPEVGNQSIPTAPQSASQSLLTAAVCLSVDKSGISMSKAVTQHNILNSNADRRMVNVSKHLFDSIELKKISSLDTKLDQEIKQRCLPFPMKQAVYLLQLALLDTMEEKLVEHQAKRKELVEEFCKVYNDEIIKSQARLGDLFNPM